jgi:hypothetical protein
MSIDNVAKILHAALILISVLFYAVQAKPRRSEIRRPQSGPPPG